MGDHFAPPGPVKVTIVRLLVHQVFRRRLLHVFGRQLRVLIVEGVHGLGRALERYETGDDLRDGVAVIHAQRELIAQALAHGVEPGRVHRLLLERLHRLQNRSRT